MGKVGGLGLVVYVTPIITCNQQSTPHHQGCVAKCVLTSIFKYNTNGLGHVHFKHVILINSDYIFLVIDSLLKYAMLKIIMGKYSS